MGGAEDAGANGCSDAEGRSRSSVMLRVGLISPVFGSGFGFHLPDLTSSAEAVSGSARGWIVVQGVDRGGQGVEGSPVLGDQQRGAEGRARTVGRGRGQAT